MPDRLRFGMVLGAAVACAGTILCFQVLNYSAINRLAETLERRDAVSTMTSQWQSGGITRTCTTTRNEGESATDFARRHQEECDAMLLLFPKDP